MKAHKTRFSDIQKIVNSRPQTGKIPFSEPSAYQGDESPYLKYPLGTIVTDIWGYKYSYVKALNDIALGDVVYIDDSGNASTPVVDENSEVIWNGIARVSKISKDSYGTVELINMPGYGGDGLTAVWGAITGTLADQEDLQKAIDASAKTATFSGLSGTISSTSTLGTALSNAAKTATFEGLSGTISSTSTLGQALATASTKADIDKLSGTRIPSDGTLGLALADSATKATFDGLTGTISSTSDLGKALTTASTKATFDGLTGTISSTSDLGKALAKKSDIATGTSISTPGVTQLDCSALQDEIVYLNNFGSSSFSAISGSPYDNTNLKTALDNKSDNAYYGKGTQTLNYITIGQDLAGKTLTFNTAAGVQNMPVGSTISFLANGVEGSFRVRLNGDVVEFLIDYGTSGVVFCHTDTVTSNWTINSYTIPPQYTSLIITSRYISNYGLPFSAVTFTMDEDLTIDCTNLWYNVMDKGRHAATLTYSKRVDTNSDRKYVIDTGVLQGEINWLATVVSEKISGVFPHYDKKIAELTDSINDLKAEIVALRSKNI